MNVIDGLNGLSSMSALLASIGLAVVAWTVGDTFVFSAACVQYWQRPPSRALKASTGLDLKGRE